MPPRFGFAAKLGPQLRVFCVHGKCQFLVAAGWKQSEHTFQMIRASRCSPARHRMAASGRFDALAKPPAKDRFFALSRLPTVPTPSGRWASADWVTSTKSVVISSKAALKHISLIHQRVDQGRPIGALLAQTALGVAIFLVFSTS
jgi:hypothetical protein